MTLSLMEHVLGEMDLFGGLDGTGSDLLGKFDAVQLDNLSLITEADKAFCEELEAQFRAYVRFTRLHQTFLEQHALKNRFLNTESIVTSRQDLLKETVKDFANAIIAHFTGAYNITIDREFVRKLTPLVTYQDIVDEIIVQLDGLNFADQAVHEMKKKLHGDLYERQSITVKGDKVTITDYLSWYWEESSWNKGNWEIKYQGRDKLERLLAGVSHFECGVVKTMNAFHKLISNQGYRSADYWFQEMDFCYLDKLAGIKFYKNGRLDLRFNSADLAKTFVHNYLTKEQKR